MDGHLPWYLWEANENIKKNSKALEFLDVFVFGIFTPCQNPLVFGDFAFVFGVFDFHTSKSFLQSLKLSLKVFVRFGCMEVKYNIIILGYI